MQLWKYILPTHQIISAHGASELIRYLSKNRVQELEEDARSSETVSAYVEALRELSTLVTTDLEDYGTIMELKNLFSEALMYVRLSHLGSIEKIPETDEKSPDFKFQTANITVYIENKALNMTGGNLTHAAIMEEAFKNKVNMEEKLESSEGGIAACEQVIQPYRYAGGNNYDPDSTRLVIETLTHKATQNLKEDQFSYGQTLLLLDLSGQLLLHDSALEHSQHFFTDTSANNCVSGELWHLAFGNIGDPISKHIEFDGLSNNDGELQTSGLLVSNSWIRGLIIHHEDSFLGFVINQNSSAAINEALETICDHVIRE